MLALYRCGRQKEALDAYREARLRFVEDLGIEPGPTLQALEQAVLRHDESLAAPARPSVAVTRLPKAADAARRPSTRARQRRRAATSRRRADRDADRARRQWQDATRSGGRRRAGAGARATGRRSWIWHPLPIRRSCRSRSPRPSGCCSLTSTSTTRSHGISGTARCCSSSTTSSRWQQPPARSRLWPLQRPACSC